MIYLLAWQTPVTIMTDVWVYHIRHLKEVDTCKQAEMVENNVFDINQRLHVHMRSSLQGRKLHISGLVVYNTFEL